VWHCLAIAAAFAAGLVGAAPAQAAQPQHCVRADIILWGDGKHDDTAALNAWFRGAAAIWAATGEPVGGAIEGHSFRLIGAVYATAGSARRLEDFRMLWPERGESVSGGTILTGSDPNAAPVSSGVTIVGGDSGEGKPFDAPDPPNDASARQNEQESCATS
jgi:hypothetical protein